MVKLKPVKIEMTLEKKRWLKKVHKDVSIFLGKVEEAYIRAEKSKLIFK